MMKHKISYLFLVFVFGLTLHVGPVSAGGINCQFAQLCSATDYVCNGGGSFNTDCGAGVEGYCEGSTSGPSCNNEFTTWDCAGDETPVCVTPPPPSPVPGCTDPDATNYNPSATVDDGSCTYAPPTFVNLNFIVTNGSQAISGALVTISQDFGNGTTRNTDAGGFANFGVWENTNIGWSVSASGCSSASGSVNSNGGTTVNVALSGCPPPPPVNNAPIGYLDAANCSTIGGWAFDPDTSGSSIAVHLYKNGPAGSGTFVSSMTTTGFRPDVNAAFGISGNHGFTFTTPDSLKDSINHSIWVHAIDSSGSGPNNLITNSGLVINCAPPTFALSVSKAGTGSGTVTSSPAGISCGATCSANFSNNTVVTLTAAASAGSSFTGWSGGGCSGTGSCVVTVTAATSVTATFTLVPFNYSLSNSGASSVTKTSGNAFTTNTITKTLSAGTTQSVTLSLSGVPSGVSYSISNSSCSPTCTSVITFTVTPSAPVGTHSITVTGAPLSKQTTFNLVISGNPSTISCSASGSTVLIGQTVTWTATVSGGTPPFTYSWSGTNIPTSPAPNTNPFSIIYSTTGLKTAIATVTDADSLQASCPASGPGSATVQVNFNPKFEEF